MELCSVLSAERDNLPSYFTEFLGFGAMAGGLDFSLTGTFGKGRFSIGTFRSGDSLGLEETGLLLARCGPIGISGSFMSLADLIGRDIVELGDAFFDDVSFICVLSDDVFTCLTRVMSSYFPR